MLNSLKEKFPHLEEKKCLEFLNEEYFEIIDDDEDKKAYIVRENGQFKVLNPAKKEIVFLAIDECLFDSSDSSRADCAVFDEKVIAFIELKHCKPKKISTHRRKAKTQLATIIDFFQRNIVLDRELEAYICVTCFDDEGVRIELPRASNLEAQLEFEEEYNTPLFYKCKKEFKI